MRAILHRFFLLCLLMSFAHVSFAYPLIGWFAGADIGWNFFNKSNTANYATSGMPGFPSDKYVLKDVDNSWQWSLVAGYQFPFEASFIEDTAWLPGFNLALEYIYTRPKLKGLIYVNGLPDAWNFRYRYQVVQQFLLLRAKLNLYQWCEFLPYLTGGIGYVRNQVKNYEDEPIPGNTLWERRYGFTSDARSNMGFSLGVGLDYWIGERFLFSVGYEFLYTGKVCTGHGEGILAQDHLCNSLSANGIKLEASYFID